MSARRLFTIEFNQPTCRRARGSVPGDGCLAVTGTMSAVNMSVAPDCGSRGKQRIMMEKRSLSRLVLFTAVLVGPSLQLAPCLAAETPMPDMHWRMIGPFRGGRTRAAAGVPDQPNVFYVGQVDGGVWKSTDYGRTWEPIFDSEDTQSIGAIAVAPSDSKVIYVASGEGLHRPDLSV